MRNSLVLVAIVAILLGCVGEKQRVVKNYTIEQFYKNTSIWHGYFSPDEANLLISSNETGIYNIFALPLDGSPAKKLTNSVKESYFALSYVPDGNGFLYQADKGGDENDHIFWVDSTNTTIDLTPFAGAKSNLFAWSRDETSFFFESNKRNQRFLDLYEKPISGFNDADDYKLVYQNDEGLDVFGISPDKKYIALIKAITTSNSELYLYDLKSKKMIKISPQTSEDDYRPQFFDLASENLFFLTNENSEFMYLAKYNMESGETEKVYETKWDIRWVENSHNEKYRVIAINEDAQYTVTMTDLNTNEEIDLPEIAGGSISSVAISKSEKLIRLTVSTSASPNNLYVYNIETKKLTKLTDTLNPEIDQRDLVEGKVIRYKSYDELDIPAVFYIPHGVSGDKKVPALVKVHGGPGGQSRLRYSALDQYLVNHGYAILAVNNRGSSGYGKTFYKMDDQKHGDVDLKDCIAAKSFLAETGFIDMERVGIFGGSYGGYMVMAALSFAPEEFAVGVNIFGVTNWLRTLKSIPPYWESMRKALYAELGDPFTSDSVRLYNISPLFHAKNVTKPLIVLQGANDPRVLQVESDEIVAAVRANGVPVEYVLFEDEGHGFAKKENQIKGYGQIKEFLDMYLKVREY